jgi:glucokinase
MNEETTTRSLKNKALERKPVGLGIDLGGTKISGALFDGDGMLSEKKIMYLENRKGKQVGELMIELIHFFIGEADSTNVKLIKVGIAIPGIYYARTGRVWAPNIPGWDDYSLLDDLNKEFQQVDVDFSIDSDRACYILGGFWKGAAMGCQNAIFMAVGTGIGAGILIDGRVLRGANDIAGATGWLALSDPYMPEYVECGCYEYHASGTGIAKVARAILSKNKSMLRGCDKKDMSDITSYDVFKAYDLKDPIATEVIQSAIKYWGKAAANLVSLFNPEKIIFGGGVFGPAIQFLDAIYQEAKRWAQPISIRQVSFEPSAFGPEAGLYGAGYLSLPEIYKLNNHPSHV